jgi:SAM-dependent methyltransferase
MRNALKTLVLSTVPPVQRLQRNRDDLLRRNAELENTIEELRAELKMRSIRHRPREYCSATSEVTAALRSSPSAEFISRITRSYRLAVEHSAVSADPSMWSGPLTERKRHEHSTLIGGNAALVKFLLENPARSQLCYGFDELCLISESRLDPASLLVSTPEWLYDNLRRLAEAVGAISLSNPEIFHWLGDVPPPIEDILTKLDAHFGVRVEFPNPYPGEVGLSTSRGVASYRAIQAIYQAWRVVNLAKSPKVLEIGAGLGRTAFYLDLFGVSDYTAIDLPLSNVAQAHFLGSTLGENAVSLYGETRRGFSVVPSHTLPSCDGHFDVVINADSLTEMSLNDATAYWRHLQSRSGVLLSINHETNPFSVRDIYLANPTASVERTPYWMRSGYVEETFRFCRDV